MNEDIVENTDNKLEEFKAYAWVNDYQGAYFNLNYGSGTLDFANFMIPKRYDQQVRKAKELRNYDICDRLLRIRQDYTLPIKGFKFKCASKKQQKFYDDFVLPLVQDFASQWIYERHTIGDVYAHFGFMPDGKTPMYLTVEDSINITPVSALGYEMYEIRLSNEFVKQVKKLQKEGKIDKLPLYLRKAIDNNGKVNNKITLDTNSMIRTTNQKQDYEEVSFPPMLRILKSLALREFLIDIDYVNAFGSQKSSIVHIQCGEKETLKNWDNPKIKQIHDLVTNRAPGQLFLTTRGDVKINPVNINLNELFDPKKFEECNKRILDFFGISIVFIPSESTGINNSTVYVSLKPLEQSIKSDRKVFEKFLNKYFKVINKANNFVEIPKVEYELTNIRENKELISELTFLFEKGIISFYDLAPIFGYDIETQLESKKKAWENRKNVSPYFENSQGLLNPVEPVPQNNNETNNTNTLQLDNKIKQI